METARQFICQDCGAHVMSFGHIAANDVDLCATCLWLRSIEDPGERDQLAFLQRVHVIDD